MSNISVLCIGGKHDGRRVSVDKYCPVVHLADPISFQLWTEPEQIPATAMITNSTYIIEHLQTDKRTFYLGRPPDKSLESTLALLIQGYRGL